METDAVGSTSTGWFPPDNTIVSASPGQRRKRPGQHVHDFDRMAYSPKRNRGEAPASEDNPNQQKDETRNKISQQTIPSAKSYFNSYKPHKTNADNTRGRRSSDVRARQSFPPFRISLADDRRYPTTEFTIIMEINNHCKLNLTFGRFTKSNDDKTSFLLYASTSAQFEHLMHISNWPERICQTEYQLTLPTKIPPQYSIVVLNIPFQWNETAFGEALKSRYPSIVRVVRLYRRGGHPLSKIRVDFASNSELGTILKAKCVLLNEDNTAFAVEPYVPPTQVLRCYNCQAYEDHVAAHCPNKSNPVCFRCAQNHPFNSQCDRPIQCANCKGSHMAGNPSCPVKSEKRHEKEQRKKAPSGTPSLPAKSNQRAWSTNTVELLFNEMRPIDAASSVSTAANTPNGGNLLKDFTDTLRSINDTLLQIKHQQDTLNQRSESLEGQVHNYLEDMKQVKHCLYEIICPMVDELSNRTQKKARGAVKEALPPLCSRLKTFIEESIYPKNTTKSSNESTDARERVQSTDEPLLRVLHHES